MNKGRFLLIAFMVFGLQLHGSSQYFSEEEIKWREMERCLLEPDENVRPSLIETSNKRLVTIIEQDEKDSSTKPIRHSEKLEIIDLEDDAYYRQSVGKSDKSKTS